MENRLAEITARINGLMREGKFKEAKPLLSEATELTRLVHGDASAEYAAILNDLGGVHRAMGAWDNGAKAFGLAAEILAQTTGNKA